LSGRTTRPVASVGSGAPDAVEFLVGHDLGLVGVYTDPDSLPLVEAVAMVPEVPERLYGAGEGTLAEVVCLRVGSRIQPH